MSLADSAAVYRCHEVSEWSCQHNGKYYVKSYLIHKFTKQITYKFIFTIYIHNKIFIRHWISIIVFIFCGVRTYLMSYCFIYTCLVWLANICGLISLALCCCMDQADWFIHVIYFQSWTWIMTEQYIHISNLRYDFIE